MDDDCELVEGSLPADAIMQLTTFTVWARDGSQYELPIVSSSLHDPHWESLCVQAMQLEEAMLHQGADIRSWLWVGARASRSQYQGTDRLPRMWAWDPQACRWIRSRDQDETAGLQMA